MASKKSNVVVAIRVRPMRAEINEARSGWELSGNTLMEVNSENETTFSFDKVFDPACDNTDVYESTVKDTIIRNVVSGYNGTVFAYGQTGSGKSHTMLGDKAESRGITAMALYDLFAGLEKEKAKGMVVKVFLEMLEIYNEQLRDLLVKKELQPPLSIRENEHGVYVHNATRKMVTSAEHCISAMQNEAEARAVAATAMNDQSSRSHCLIRILVEKTQSFDASDSESDTDGSPKDTTLGSRKKLQKKVVSSLNLVDLAGSERIAKTGATGQRMVEGGHINKSLTTLTTVIHKLSEPHKPGQHRHIPFRDSKLTNLLKTALGGNSFTTVFCCITAAEQHTDESRSTLHFAQRAKTIRNEIHVNEVMDNKARLRELELEVKRLRRQAVAMDIYLWSKDLKLRNTAQLQQATTGDSEHVARLESLVQQLSEENEALKEEAQQAAQFMATAGVPSGHVDPAAMGAFADDEATAALRTELAELQAALSDATQDKLMLTESLNEIEHICDGLETEGIAKDEEAAALKQRLKASDAQNQTLQQEVELVTQQLGQLQLSRQADERNMLDRARGDELLEALTKQQIEHQGLQLEHSTLLDMFSRAEIDATTAKQGLIEDMEELKAKAETQHREQVESRAALWRFIGLGHQITYGEAMDPSTTKLSGPVKPHHIEQALKTISMFISSRSARPPNPGSPPREDREAAPQASPAARGNPELEARIKELEATLQSKDAQRDVIIDTKLKRMQELVLRLHSTNQCLLGDVHRVAEENNVLHDLIRKESKLYKMAISDGLEPVSEELLKGRALFTQVPQPPHWHN